MGATVIDRLNNVRAIDTVADARAAD